MDRIREVEPLHHVAQRILVGTHGAYTMSILEGPASEPVCEVRSWERPTEVPYAWISDSEDALAPFHVTVYLPEDPDTPLIGPKPTTAQELVGTVFQMLAEAKEREPISASPQEEALQQIQHIAHQERIANIAEGQRPDED